MSDFRIGCAVWAILTAAGNILLGSLALSGVYFPWELYLAAPAGAALGAGAMLWGLGGQS